MNKEIEMSMQTNIRLIATAQEMLRLLTLINAEFQSDPMSVQCFDLRIVADVKSVVAKADGKETP